MNTQDTRNRISRFGVMEKYTNYLNELYNLLQNDENISMPSLSRKYKTGTQLSIVLQNLKIIKKISKNRYVWIGKKPSKEMVFKLIEECRNYGNIKAKDIAERKIDFNNQIEIKFKEPVKRKYTKRQEIKQTENNIYSLNIFWGLIKIQKN
jgi:hypothetical protein